MGTLDAYVYSNGLQFHWLGWGPSVKEEAAILYSRQLSHRFELEGRNLFSLVSQITNTAQM